MKLAEFAWTFCSKLMFSLCTEKFASVTILFSDIVTFTNIAAAVQPIDIVNMLNDLYHKFDNCSEKNDVYKVVHSDGRTSYCSKLNPIHWLIQDLPDAWGEGERQHLSLR